jgi:hypothetical protein
LALGAVIVGALGPGPVPSGDLLLGSGIFSVGWLVLFIAGLFKFGWRGLFLLLGLPGAILWPALLLALHFEWVP